MTNRKMVLKIKQQKKNLIETWDEEDRNGSTIQCYYKIHPISSPNRVNGIREKTTVLWLLCWR